MLSGNEKNNENTNGKNTNSKSFTHLAVSDWTWAFRRKYDNIGPNLAASLPQHIKDLALVTNSAAMQADHSYQIDKFSGLKIKLKKNSETIQLPWWFNSQFTSQLKACFSLISQETFLLF